MVQLTQLRQFVRQGSHLDIRTILKPPLIKLLRREHSYLRMHAILHVQKVPLKATLPQPFEETEGEPGANNVIGESCRWELLLITD